MDNELWWNDAPVFLFGRSIYMATPKGLAVLTECDGSQFHHTRTSVPFTCLWAG